MSNSEINDFLNDKKQPNATGEIDSFLKDAPPQERTVGGFLKDTYHGLVKGANIAARGMIGLNDLLRGSNSNENLKSLGVDFAAQAKAAGELKSDAAKRKAQEMSNQEGFLNTVAYGAKNIDAVADTAIESVPQMFMGAGIGNATGKMLGLGAVARGAISEGAMQTGTSYADAQDNSKTGQVSDRQKLAAIGSGVTTGLISLAGGKLANKLGIGDVDTAIASRIAGEVGQTAASPTTWGGYAKNIGKGFISEGVLEEMPQSATEKMWQNYADEKNLTQGVGNAAAIGAMSGGIMGAGMNAFNLPNRQTPPNNGADGTPTEVSSPSQINPEYDPNTPQIPYLPQQLPSQIPYMPKSDTITVDENGVAFTEQNINDYLQGQQEKDRTERNTNILRDINDITPVPNESNGFNSDIPNALPSPQNDFIVDETGTTYTRQDQNQQIQEQRQANIEKLAARLRGDTVNDVTPVPTESIGFGVEPQQTPSQKPSEKLGLDPNQGALSSAATVAVDTGASPITAHLQTTPQIVDSPLTQAEQIATQNLSDGGSPLSNENQTTQNPLAVNNAALLSDISGQLSNARQASQSIPKAQVADLWDSQAPEQRKAILDSIYGDNAKSTAHMQKVFNQLPIPTRRQITDLAQQTVDNNVQDTLISQTPSLPQEGEQTQALARNDSAVVTNEQGQPKVFGSVKVASGFVTKNGLMDTHDIVPMGSKFVVAEKPQTQEQTQEQALQTIPKLYGNESYIQTGNERHPTRVAIVEADNLVPNDKDTDNQFRDRTRVASQAQIDSIVNNLDPRQLGDTTTMATGSPTLANDGRTIIAGNGRTQAIKKAYAMGKAEEYRQSVIEQARQHGIDPSVVAGMKNPVLVKEFANPVDTKQMAIASNENAGLAMSAKEQARADSERLPDISTLIADDKGDINHVGNSQIFRQFIQAMPNEARASMMTSNGMLSQEGLKRLQNAVLYKAYGNSKTFDDMVENTDADMKNAIKGLVNIAPKVARVKDGIAQGVIHNADISDEITNALTKLQQIRQNGMSVGDYLAQQGLFEEDLSPVAKQLVAYLDKNIRSAKAITDLLSAYYDNLEVLGNPNQADMFGNAPVANKQSLLNQSMEQANDKTNGQSADLFGQNRTDTNAETQSDRPAGKSAIELVRPDQSEGNGNGVGKSDKISFGIRQNLTDLPDVKVVSINDLGLNFNDTKQLADELLRELQKAPLGTLHNNDTNWNFVVGKKDRLKMGDNKNLSHATSQAIQGIINLVENAVLVETHADGAHENNHVKAVHRLYAPALIGNTVYRVKLTVKDYVLNDGKERKNLHAIEAVEIENAPMGTLPSDENQGIVQPTSERQTISIADLLKGAIGENGGILLKSTSPLVAPAKQSTAQTSETLGSPTSSDNSLSQIQKPVNPENLTPSQQKMLEIIGNLAENDPKKADYLQQAQQVDSSDTEEGKAERSKLMKEISTYANVQGKKLKLQEEFEQLGYTVTANHAEVDNANYEANTTLTAKKGDKSIEIKINKTIVNKRANDNTRDGFFVNDSNNEYRLGLNEPDIAQRIDSHTNNNDAPFNKDYFTDKRPRLEIGENPTDWQQRMAGQLARLYDNDPALAGFTARANDRSLGGTKKNSLRLDIKRYADEKARTGEALLESEVTDRINNIYHGGQIKYSQMGVEQGYQRDLMVTHNITADGIIHADKMGGLPFASVAVTKQQNPLDSFGEVTLIGDKNYIDPQNGAEVFGSDIYSPRYPSVYHEANSQDIDKVYQQFKASSETIKDSNLFHDLNNRIGNESVKTVLSNSPSVQYQFLQEQNIDVPLVYKGTVTSKSWGLPSVQEALKNGVKLYDIRSNKPLLTAIMQDTLKNEQAELDAIDPNQQGTKFAIKFKQRNINELKQAIESQDFFANNYIVGIIGEIEKNALNPSQDKQYDFAGTKKALQQAVEDHQKEFNDYIDKITNTIRVKEKLNDGETRTGEDKYVAHTLGNVVKKLKKDLRGGERSFYGLPSIRAKVTPKFDSINDIQYNKHRLMNDEEFEAVKTEVEGELEQLKNTLKLSDMYRMEDVLSDLIDSNAGKAFKQYGIKNTASNRQAVSDFLAKLEQMPTTYFEGKAKEVTQFSDFKGAVVPNNLSPKARKILEDAGLKIYTYDESDKENRKATITQATNELDASIGGILFSQQAKQIIDNFNHELEQLAKGELNGSHIFKLGMPNDILKSTGFPDLPIELKASKLSEKANADWHKFDIVELKDLPKALQNPIAVFRYFGQGRNVITQLEISGKQLLVGIHFNQKSNGIEINDIRGLFPKDNHEWLNWITQKDKNGDDKLLYADKQKIQTLIDQQRTNLAEVAYLDLDLVESILQNHQNVNTKSSQTSQGSTNTTPKQVQSVLTEKFGQKTIDKLLANNDLKIVTLAQARQQFPNENIPDKADGFYINNTAYLIADNIQANMIIPTFLHELGGHGGYQTLMSEGVYQSFKREFDSLVASGNKLAIEAKALADKHSRTQQEANDEYLPYLISLASRNQGNSKIKSLLNRIVLAVKSFIRNNFGVSLKITPNDIVALAEKMASERANNAVQVGSQATQFSQNSPQRKQEIYNFLTGEPVANILSGLIKRDSEGKVISQAKEYMRNWLANNRPDGIFHHPEIGEIQLTQAGIKNSASKMSADVHINAIPAVPYILENSIVLEETMDKDGKPIKNYILAAPIKIDNETYYAVVRLRQDSDNATKRPFFYVVAAELESEAQKNAALTLKTQDLENNSISTGGKNRSQISTLKDHFTQMDIHGGKNRLLNILHEALNVNNQNDSRYSNLSTQQENDTTLENLDIKFSQLSDYLSEKGDTLTETGKQTIDKLSQTLTDLFANPQQFFKDMGKGVANKGKDHLGVGLSLLGRRQIVDIYGDTIKGLKEYSDIVTQMDADSNENAFKADKLANQWGKLSKSESKALADIMHKATQKGIDPSKPRQQGVNGMQYGQLKANYDRLSDNAKAIYAQARDDYVQHRKDLHEAMVDRVKRNDKLTAEQKAKLLDGLRAEYKASETVFFPLTRFGDYAVVVRDKNGNVVNVSRAESKNQAEKIREQLVKNNPNYKVGSVVLSREMDTHLGEINAELLSDMQSMKNELNLGDDVYQAYINSLLDRQFANNGVDLKGLDGFYHDARRVYAYHMSRGSNYVSKIRHTDQLKAKLNEMQNHIDDNIDKDGFDSVVAQRVVDEMNKRHEAMMNPQTSPLSTALTSLGYIYLMGLSPASALVNLSQTALIAYPMMGAKYGYQTTAKHMTQVSALLAKNKNDLTSILTGEEKRQFDEAVRRGTIDMTMAHDLAGVANGENNAVSRVMKPYMKMASFMFHQAEKYNRQATFLATYRMEVAKGTDSQTAMKRAIAMTYESQFDYASSNRARILQGNPQRVIFLFKQYSQNMIYTLARQTYLSFKGKTAEERKLARKTIGGIMLAHAMTAGVLGLPVVITAPLLAVFSALNGGGDDDEPYDAQVAFRNMLADLFGDDVAEVIAKGLPRAIGMDLSSRVGLNTLLFPQVQDGLEGQAYAQSLVAGAVGPVAGVGINMAKGMEQISQGQTQQGMENMLPKSIRDVMKSYRYATKGNVDKSGVEIVAKENVSASDIIQQGLGFRSGKFAQAQEGKSAIYQANRQLSHRHAELMARFAQAKIAGDDDEANKVWQEIRVYNDKIGVDYPNLKITLPKLYQSIKQRKRRIVEAQNGIYLPNSRTASREYGAFATE